MKVFGLRFAVHALITACALFAANRSIGADIVASSAPDPQAKVDYCEECHGLSGQGYAGFFTMPRLAGQTTEYLENQLRAFAEHRRDKDILIDMAKIHGLSPSMRAALAERFRGLNPAPVGGALKNLVASG